MVLVPVLLWPALPTGTGPLGEQLQRTLQCVGMMWHLWALMKVTAAGNWALASGCSLP